MKDNKIKHYVFLLSIIFIITYAYGNDIITITLDKAKLIGKEYLCDYGHYTLCGSDVNIKGDDNNSKWKSFIHLQPSILEYENIKKMKLKKKQYWAIYYSRTREPKVNPDGSINVLLHGGAWVFIDKNNGKVLGHLREQ